jgi:PAS domain S-box-containing protein
MAFEKNTLDAAQHNRIAQVLHHLGIIAERADQGIVITDRDGTIHFANTAWANMHGHNKSRKILGKSIISFFDKDSAKNNLIQLVKQARISGCASAVLQHRKLDFSIFPARTKITALKDKNGCPSALIIFSTDISEIENLQKQLTETTNKLQDSRRQIELLNHQLEELKHQPATAPAKDDQPATAPAKDDQLEQKNQPSTAPPTEEKLEQTCPEHSRGKNPPLTQLLLESKISSRRSEAKTEISTCSELACPELVERVESTQDVAPANSSKASKHAPKPFNAERLKALAYLSRRLNEPPTEAPQPPLHKLTDRAYPDDDNLENLPPLLDIEQLRAVAEIAKRLS